MGPTWAAGTRNAHQTFHQDPTRPINMRVRSPTFTGLLAHHRPAKVATDGGK
jgi:hypothetical protein